MINFFCITKESMIRDICDFVDIEYNETESAVLYELFLYVKNDEQSTVDILEQVDWKFIKENNKKLIITHRVVYHLKFFKEAILDYIKRYDCKDNVLWYSFNPYEANDKDVNVIFFDPINHVNFEMDLLAKERNDKVGGICKFKKITDFTFKTFEKSDKYFISTNKRHASYRVLSNHLLNRKDLINKGYYSFYPRQKEWYDDEVEKEWLDYFSENKEVLERNNITIEQVQEDVSKNYILDSEAIKGLWLQLESIESFYEKSLIAHVTESIANDSEMYITEKTYIPILTGRPFLVIGNKHLLRFLKNYYGFKTFDKIFDESYDNETCQITKTIKVTDELEKFCSLPLSKAKEKVESIKHILEHNRKICDNMDRTLLFKKTLTKIIEG